MLAAQSSSCLSSHPARPRQPRGGRRRARRGASGRDQSLPRQRAALALEHGFRRVFVNDPEVAVAIIARYHDRLGRISSGWKITEKAMEVLWAGDRRDPDGRLDALGGRGPSL